MNGERVAVTGSSGLLGHQVVAELRTHRYRVLAVDRRPPRVDDPAVEAVLWDGRDVSALGAVLDGCSGLVHLAAIPAPYGHPDEDVFGNNTMATFAALLAAAKVGIQRCVIASSGSAYGTAWSPEPTHVRYVPVDEAHPMENQDPYGLSKEVDERTAAMFSRRYGMSVAALRFHWIADAATLRAALAERERSRRNWAEELRSLWGYVDVRDAARACRLAIEMAKERPYGFVPLNIAAADSLSSEPIAGLLAEHAPDIEVRAELGPTNGAFAIDRAFEVISWRPEHSWRDK